MLFASKINKARTLALLLIFFGFGIMFLGTGLMYMKWIGQSGVMVFFLLGMLVTFSSVIIYFWVGVLSTQAVKVNCPQCEKVTKILGKTDQCMHCKATLTLDPEQASSNKDS
ncbi:UPF0295 protein YgzB [Marinithermofilum abyssi]|uniref:UPF0295 protein YgzB n=1 Tax=Marinithermofilum abyssi TaxID=1571185 RepID=A0A8J2Y9T0_9BACL|nr:DUF2614 family zinc ribbon-containing protein [Marinithermofilum abyssi]GGE27158.1 UPF0295 protein YgzB [Marinithermofilum abyssi]